eukprot:CAMPEP_0118983854 /NCGR_PEP_ID=MMETSP1173-20130426/36448_1 /TAXON_ID=1034831 /ORGANISM="Rhizochromulina marina cf, Strain CCMP1243" /LENGTH=71 /DNA_ID=CAMNT_0006934475 /DNA_START=347 /DNA_END=558 /DNA_ORIENTATION=-
MQWMWNAWLQRPHIGGQSSPGALQSGQHASKGIRQMPQHSSFTFQDHVATPCQRLTLTFISCSPHGPPEDP